MANSNTGKDNSAIFIQHTNVRSFLFMYSSFKDFFCPQYYLEMSQLLNHTSTHGLLDKSVILEKYIPKGKRMLQVDISNLKCRHKDFGNLDGVRDNLKVIHD